jgi:hypothetical protein
MAFTASGGLITQTFQTRDLNFSGLVGLPGVTRTVDSGTTYYDLSTNRLSIQGTIFHDPEKEVLIFHHNATGIVTPAQVIYVYSAVAGWSSGHTYTRDAENYVVVNKASHGFLAGDAVQIRQSYNSILGDMEDLNRVHRIRSTTTSTFTLDDSTTYRIPTAVGQYLFRPCYNYGKEITVGGRTRYSRNTGIFITGNSTTNYNTNEAGFANLASSSQGGFFWARGGSILSNRPFSLLGALDVKGTNLIGTRNIENRGFGYGFMRDVTLTNVDTTDLRALTDPGFIVEQATFFEIDNDPYYQQIIYDLDVSKNAADSDIGHSYATTNPHRDWVIINSANGSNIKPMWRISSASQKGGCTIKKQVSLNLKDTNNTAISGVKVYLKDTPSPYAKKVTFPKPTNLSYQYYSGAGSESGGVYDVVNGTITYNLTGAITYQKTTDSSGNVETFSVTTAYQFLEYDSTQSAALSANGGPYNIPSFNTYWRESDNAVPGITDWDTTRFGGFYKVDRRSDSGTSADDFTFKFCSYRHSLATSIQALKGTGVLSVNWVLFNDATITETNKTIVDAYTTIDTPEKFYDRAKSYLYDNFAGQTSTIVTRNGNVINVGSYNVVIDTLAASAFAFNGTTLTIKADNFVGTIQTTGTLTLLNGAFNTDPRYIDLTLDGASIAIYDDVAALRYYTSTDQNITLPLSSTGLWTYKYSKYGYKLGQGSFTVNGGVIEITPISIPDVYVSDTVTNVSAYNTFYKTQQIYDYLSYYRTTSAGLGYGDLNSYISTLDIGSKNIIIFDSASPAFSYDGSTFTLNTLNLSGAAITTSGTISLSGNSSISDIRLTTNVLDQTPADLTNVDINGTLAYNTDSPASITYTNTTVSTVVNNGTGTVLIQRINSSINNATDPEIDDYAPTIINVTPNGGSVAIYNNLDARQYFIKTNSTVVLPYDATGTWSYKVAKYGFDLINQPFTINSSTGATINIAPNYIPDNFINELEINVAAYTDLNNANQIHDYLMYFQTLSGGIDYGDLEFETFGTITFTGGLALSADASSMVSLSGSTLVLKSTYLTDDIILVSPDNITQHSGNTISDGVKLRANNLDSEIYFDTVDSITFFPNGSDRDNNVNGNITLNSVSIYRFKYGSTINGITFTNNIYARLVVGGATLLITSPIAIGTNTIDFSITGNLQTLNNNLRIVNQGIQKSSILVPHTTNI